MCSVSFWRLQLLQNIIIYHKENSTGYYIKRSEESVNNMPKSIFNQLMFCKKAYPWLYENECRLICQN